MRPVTPTQTRGRESSRDRSSRWLDFNQPLQIDLIGCTGTGKTTLAKAMVRTCREEGIDAWLSEDFVIRQFRLQLIRSGFWRRRLLEVVSVAYGILTWHRHRAFYSLAWRVSRATPGPWLYKISLIRLTLRKTAIHEIVQRRIKGGQVVISDNEAVLQGAHHLFVHPAGTSNTDLISEFVRIAPHPDVVVYLHAPEHVVIDRTLRRGHTRLGHQPHSAVARFVRHATGTFERIASDPSLRDVLLTVDVATTGFAVDAKDGAEQALAIAARLVTNGLDARASAAQPDDTVTDFSEPECLTRLLARLNNDVTYCCIDRHRLSIPRTEVHARLNLLVDRTQLPPVQAILAELGFKQTQSPERVDHGIRHFFARDATTGRLIRVELSTDVFAGKAVRYHVPFETMLLTNAAVLDSVRVPTYTATFVLFVVKTYIEYGTAAGLWRIGKRRRELEEEFRRLESHCSVSEALALVQRHCPCLGEQLFLKCVKALHNNESLMRRVGLARRVRQRLHIFATPRRGNHVSATSSLTATSRHDGHGGIGTQRTWHTGGAVIAFVGADATGKSTLAGETARWLDRAVSVDVAHLGKPPSTWWTAPLNVALWTWHAIRGRGRRWKPRDLSAEKTSKSSAVGWSSLIYAFRAIALAYERRRAVMTVQRAAANGTVVLCDRYPCNVVGAMDGPRLNGVSRVRGARARAYRALTRLERRLYDGLLPPDILIKLTASIETAKQRNRDRVKADKHPDDELEERHSLRRGAWDLSCGRVHEMDTEGSVGDTVLAVQRAVWTGL